MTTSIHELRHGSLAPRWAVKLGFVIGLGLALGIPLIVMCFGVYEQSLPDSTVERIGPTTELKITPYAFGGFGVLVASMVFLWPMVAGRISRKDSKAVMRLILIGTLTGPTCAAIGGVLYAYRSSDLGSGILYVAACLPLVWLWYLCIDAQFARVGSRSKFEEEQDAPRLSPTLTDSQH